MSIATDEAEQKYPVRTDADDPMYKYVEAIAGYPAAKRQGYVDGRTAEPTFSESDELVNELDDLGIPLRIDEALKILKALRKAVTE